jgi:hypothetical protein
MNGIPTTAELQSLTKPYLDLILANLGTSVGIVRPVAPVAPTVPTTRDGWGKPTGAASPSAPATTEQLVTGFLYQLEDDTRVRAGSEGGNIAIPDWELILGIEAPVGTPGFTIRYRNFTYLPIGLAEDLGNQGIAWRVRLRAPDLRGAQ